MEQEPSEKRAIFFVLDMLLVIGAIASIVTIDRGKWLIENPAFYSVTDGEQNATMIYGPDAGEWIILQTGALCQKADQSGNTPAKDPVDGTAAMKTTASQGTAVAMADCGQ